MPKFYDRRGNARLEMTDGPRAVYLMLENANRASRASEISSRLELSLGDVVARSDQRQSLALSTVTEKQTRSRHTAIGRG